MAKRKKPERDLHYVVADFLHAVLPPEVLWTTIGHGSGGKARGGQLKGMGVRPGVPDIVIFWWMNDRSCVLWLELKSDKGRLSKEQIKFFELADILDHAFCVCRSLDDVELALKNCDVPTRGSIAA